MFDYLKPLMLKKPKRVLLQIGANDCAFKTSEDIIADMRSLKAWIKSINKDCEDAFCEMPLRTDGKKANTTRESFNGILDSISDRPCARNSDIGERNLSVSGFLKVLHLNPSGTRLLAMKILSFLTANGI